MLEKDKKCIEFSIRSMMLTHRPYQKDTEIEITGMIPGRNIIGENNPFDIPGDVVMIPKRDFEKLQVENEELKKAINKIDEVCYETLVDIINKLDQDIDKWQKATKCNSPEEAEKKIKLLVDDINVLMRVNDDLM